MAMKDIEWPPVEEWSKWKHAHSVCECGTIFVEGTPHRDEQGRPLCLECDQPLTS